MIFLNVTRGSVSCEIVLNCCYGSFCCFCISARCLRLDYTEASAKHPNSGGAERLQRSFQITESETQKWISSSKMKRGWCGILPQVSLHDCMFISAFSLVDLPRKALDSTAQTQEMQKCEDIFRSLNRCFAAACFIFLLV